MTSKYRCCAAGLIALLAPFGLAQAPASAPPPTNPPSKIQSLKLDTGKQIFEAACIGCHGSNGKGALESSTAFERPATFPDFSDCSGSMRERENDYKAAIYYGGHGRGFSEIMPSFSEALTIPQIDKLVQYLRSFCAEPGWPKGELNFPRAMATEKAFPEDEAIITTAITTKGTPSVSNELAYEKRLGKLTQLELGIPFSAAKDSGNWYGGVGDIRVGLKRVLGQSLRTGTILSAQGEVALPTGNRNRGFGNGVTLFETFGALGQALPGNSFVQVQAGMEFPTSSKNLPRATFWRTALGKSIQADRGLGRMWTPMVEFLADRDLVKGARTNWDVLPQFQVTLSKRQHIRANVGVRVPANNTAGRSTQVVFYLLWDWFDGGLREGWK